MKKLRHSFLAFAALALLTRIATAQDMPLSMLLIDGEGWQVVSEGHGFVDGPCADDKGNFYFSDIRKPAIYRIAPDGQQTVLIEQPASGLKFGPDGRLYACQGSKKRLVAFDLPGGKETVIAEDVQPNDLVVTRKGHIYFTETGKKQVTFVNPKTGEKKAADTGITAPNGITLSPDQGTLAVSDFRGPYVWAFRIEKDGSLTAKEPYMTMRTEVDVNAKPEDGRSPVYKNFCNGDGMTSDMQGRYYVATSLGVQVYDPTGRMSGVLPRPSDKAMTSVGFAGPQMEFLYATCADKVFRRKTKARGALYFIDPPAAVAPAKK
jgi:enterochelin esterase family protein